MSQQQKGHALECNVLLNCKGVPDTLVGKGHVYYVPYRSLCSYVDTEHLLFYVSNTTLTGNIGCSALSVFCWYAVLLW
jgi:hypothetical protein